MQAFLVVPGHPEGGRQFDVVDSLSFTKDMVELVMVMVDPYLALHQAGLL